jgi:hypothetical protein
MTENITQQQGTVWDDKAGEWRARAEQAEEAAVKKATRAEAEAEAEQKTTVVELGDGQTVEFEVLDDTPRPAYELKTHDMPTVELTDQRQAWITQFSEAAPSASIAQPVAQALLDAVVDASAAFNVEQDLTNAEQADTLLRAHVGDEAATTILGKAQAFVRSKPKLGAYLDETGLGNDIGVLMALSMAADGVYALTPQKAQAELSKITSDQKSDYYSTDARRRKLAVLKVGVLSRIVHGEANEVTELNKQFHQSVQEKLKPAAVPPKPDAVAAARKEAAQMLGDRESPLNKFRPGDPRRAEAQARYFALLNIIAP